jgi:hypothetical protein
MERGIIAAAGARACALSVRCAVRLYSIAHSFVIISWCCSLRGFGAVLGRALRFSHKNAAVLAAPVRALSVRALCVSIP